MITYEPFWETLKSRNISQYTLIKKYNVSTGQLSRLRANNYVSTHTIDMLCQILDCEVQDIIQYRQK